MTHRSADRIQLAAGQYWLVTILEYEENLVLESVHLKIIGVQPGYWSALVFGSQEITTLAGLDTLSIHQTVRTSCVPDDGSFRPKKRSHRLVWLQHFSSIGAPKAGDLWVGDL